MTGEPRRALYVGRFQPLHLGHLDVLRTICDAGDVEAVLLAVGSSQYDHTCKSPVAPWAHNPFTIAERLEMLRRSLTEGMTKPWDARPVPDFHDWDLWYDHIATYLPPVRIIYSCDAAEREFFGARGVEARTFPRRFPFHAGDVRRRMAAGEAYRDDLPAGTLEVLDRIGAEERLRVLFARDRAERQR